MGGPARCWANLQSTLDATRRLQPVFCGSGGGLSCAALGESPGLPCQNVERKATDGRGSPSPCPMSLLPPSSLPPIRPPPPPGPSPPHVAISSVGGWTASSKQANISRLLQRAGSGRPAFLGGTTNPGSARVVPRGVGIRSHFVAIAQAEGEWVDDRHRSDDIGLRSRRGSSVSLLYLGADWGGVRVRGEEDGGL